MPYTDQIQYGKRIIRFSVIYADRKTMEIAVHPDTNIIVKAPRDTEKEKIKKRIHKRACWIKKQIDYFKQFEPRASKPRYLGGETHLYLGRQYRLKIARAKQNNVKLIRGFFLVSCALKPTPKNIKDLLSEWYSEHAEKIFKERFQHCWEQFHQKGVTCPALHIRTMKTRWGSLSPKGTLTLNSSLIHAPRPCIEYVITHELCHLKHKGHNAQFYKLLSRMLPDWEKRKQRLEMMLA